MSDSSDEPFPIIEEPTREMDADDPGSDAWAVDGTDVLDCIDERRSILDQPAVGIPPQIGDYRIIKQIGSGGMGQVFLAEHVRMQRAVAVKTLQFERRQNSAAIDRFYDEVRTASKLMHPNIVTAFDAGESDGIHYLAMEYVAGMTLTQVVGRRGPMQIGETAAVIRQAALGLLHSHRAGIVHRDIKPGNLMRANDGTIKVLDLGLAQIDTLLLSGSSSRNPDMGLSEMGDLKSNRVRRLIGTLAYMSPEQLESPETADARSDIYSLGAVMHFLLTSRPPFTGENLDIVYGHRHGEIPDLMELRDDVDLNFANIFARMIAKSPDQRYASMDEVVDELSGYSDRSNSPLWLAEFSRHQARDEVSTASVESTATSISQVLAIDVGMFYSAAASASPSGGVKLLTAGERGQLLMRMALASERDRLLLSNDAIELRATKPASVAHCLPIYFGNSTFERVFMSRKCPPEVLMGILLREIVKNAWGDQSSPDATAITVPSIYDQLHRQCLMIAARIAGLQSIRLVDRCVAAVQSTLLDSPRDSMIEDATVLESKSDETVLFVSVTGQGSEVAVVRRDGLRLHQLSTAGHWHTGSLAWLRRLVELASEKFVAEYGLNPKESLSSASGLQIACERAMNSLLLMSHVHITLDLGNQQLSVSITRKEWLSRTADLLAGLRNSIDVALSRAKVDLGSINRCVTMGTLLGVPEVRDSLSIGLGDGLKSITVDRSDVARGAAACLAGELPGRTSWTLPPRCVTSQEIGILVEDRKGRRRILPVIPRGTPLPARTNRRLTMGKKQSKMRLSLVESSGVKGDEWQILGQYESDANEPSSGGSRLIGFEVNVNGLLTVRSQTLGVHGTTRPKPMPTPTLTDEAIASWRQWLDKIR